MKIAFITDLHIDTEGQFPLSLDTRGQFLSVLKHIASESFDLIILGGDICHRNGEAAVYRWVSESIRTFGIPSVSISGNHDDSSLLASHLMPECQVFEGELFYTQKINGIDMLFLDTSKGYMSEFQYDWLDNQIKNAAEQVFIFMHHPPMLCYSAHMEPVYQFGQMSQFKSICDNWPEITFNIFTGHYHLDRHFTQDNMRVWIAPSTFVQIDPNSSVFRPFNDKIGYREIIIERNTKFYTQTRYLEQIVYQ